MSDDLLPEKPLPNALTEYEAPDWDVLAQSKFSTQRAELCKLARHSADAKMYVEGCIREISEAAAGASVLQTVAHVERLLEPLAVELSRAVEFVKEERENPGEGWTPSRHIRQLGQVLKAEKGVRDLMGCARELATMKVTVNNQVVTHNYSDLRKPSIVDAEVVPDVSALDASFQEAVDGGV